MRIHEIFVTILDIETFFATSQQCFEGELVLMQVQESLQELKIFCNSNLTPNLQAQYKILCSVTFLLSFIIFEVSQVLWWITLLFTPSNIFLCK